MTAAAEVKGMPAAVEAERWVLGSVLLRGSIPPEAEGLAPGDFGLRKHGTIWRAMRALADTRRRIDFITLSDTLERRNEFASVEGSAFLFSLTEGLPALRDVSAHVGLVREKAALRRLAAIGQSLVAEAIEQRPVAEIVERVKAQLEATATVETQGAERFGLAAIEAEYQRHADSIDGVRIRLGLGRFDELTGGAMPGEVVTVIARTAVGKSALAQNVIANVLAAHSDVGVVFFSLEMPRLQAFERQQQIAGGISRDGVLYLYRNDAAAVPDFAKRYNGRLLIVDDARLDLAAMKRFVRGAVASKAVSPVRFVVLDYLGLLDHGNRRASLTERVSELARAVKQTAKELEAVVLLIAQTSRTAGDGSEEVSLVDARDSGAIEDSADFMIGAWRPELRKGISQTEFADCHGQIHCKLLKARRGLKDRWVMRFEGETMRVSSQSQGRTKADRMG